MSQTFSIVIPVYNEARRIPKSIGEIFTFFDSQPEKTEIIFVNDGSRDETLAVLEQYKAQYEFSIVTYDENRGKGYAVRQGVAAAQGDWVVFFDIDLATPLSAFQDLVASCTADDAVVIGSRRLDSSRIEKAESRIRTFLGHGFTKLSNMLVPRVTDFTCGFKCFSKKAAAEIFSRARIDRWGFDTELLYIAHIHGLPIRQMPVRWNHDDDSRVRVVRAILSSLSELLRMWGYKLLGYYR